MKLRMPEMPPATLLALSTVTTCFPPSYFCRRAAAAIKRPRKLHSRAAIRTTRGESNAATSCARLSKEHPEVRGHRHWDTILRGGVASHHAGHIPSWKLVIEKLMSAGLLDAIFATATVAAGVDFPRTHRCAYRR
jgi:superfamily II RNA helicase